jgi:hypothetical protein
MHRRPVVAAVTVIVALTACGVTADSPPPTAAELRRALLTVDDLGPGFTAADGDDGGGDERDSGEVSSGSKQCRSLANRIGSRGGGDSDAEAAFFTADGAAVFHTYDRRDDSDADNVDVDELVELIDTCRTLTIDTGDSVGTAGLTGGPVDGLGEEAVELRLSFELTEPVEATFDGVLYLWQRDDVSGAVIAVDGLDPSTGDAVPVGVDRARGWAETADRRLVAVIEG